MLSDILGQEEVAKRLLTAFRQGRLAHAYILSGPDGVGKMPFAVELAKTLLCAHRDEPGFADACEQCPSCRKVRHGNHEDLIIVEPAGKADIIKFEMTNELIEVLRLKARSGEHRFVIIHGADKMHESTANHFLKTLEEPPTDVTFLLLTSRLPALLPTIVSRCQVVRMRRTPADRIAAFLQARGYEAPKARLYAALADGCPGKAIAMDESGAFERLERLLRRIEELSPENDVELASATLADNKGATLTATRDSLVEELGLLAALCRDMTLLAEGADARLYNPDLPEPLRRRARQAGSDALRGLTLAVLEARSDIQRFVNPDLVIGRLFTELAARVPGK